MLERQLTRQMMVLDTYVPMVQAFAMTTPSAPTSSAVAAPLIQAIENCWRAIQANHPEVPDVVVTLGAGRISRGLKLGHFAASVWTDGTTDIHELFVGGEGLQRGAQALMGTLIHEAGHALAEARGVKDTSRQGRYHNEKFRRIAEEMGIEVSHDASLGWSSTVMPDQTALAYQEAIMDLDMTMTAWRHGAEGMIFGPGGVPVAGPGNRPAPRPGGRTSSNNGLSVSCGCGRKIRVSQTVLALGGITCNVCQEEFTE